MKLSLEEKQYVFSFPKEEQKKQYRKIYYQKNKKNKHEKEIEKLQNLKLKLEQEKQHRKIYYQKNKKRISEWRKLPKEERERRNKERIRINQEYLRNNPIEIILI